MVILAYGFIAWSPGLGCPWALCREVEHQGRSVWWKKATNFMKQESERNWIQGHLIPELPPQFFLFFFWDRVLLSCWGWPWTSDPRTSASCVAGIKGVCHHAGSNIPLKGTAPLTRSQLLKVPPPLSRTSLKTKPSTHWPLRTFKIQTIVSWKHKPASTRTAWPLSVPFQSLYL